MTIKTKLYIISAISIGSVLIIGLFIFFVSQQLTQKIEECEIAEEISRGIFDLNILTNDYLLYQEERARIQWQSRYDSLATFFRPEAVAVFDEDEKDLLRDLGKDYENIREIFTKLIAGREQQPSNSEEESTASKELEERLIGQLLIHSQTIVSKTTKLNKNAHNKLIEKQHQARIFIFGFLVILVLLIIAVVSWVIYNVVKPIGLFQKGAKAISKGNLTYRIDIEREDEIGQLATSFNEMTAELEKIYPILKERVKELSAIYETSRIMEKSTDLEKALNEIVKILSSAYQFPELACAKIIYNGKEYQTTNFKETKWKQTAIIKLANKEAGMVKVFYLKKKPFLIEEEKMIKEVASQIGNIIERKRAGKKLRESENKLESIISSIPDLIFIIDDNSRFSFYHAPLLEKLYTSPKKFMGKKYSEVLPPSVCQQIDRAIEKNKKGITDEFEYSLRVEGKTQWSYAKVAPMLIEKKFIGSLVLTRDITEIKEAEEEREEKIVLEQQLVQQKEIDKMKTEIVSITSHQLRTPSSIIKGNLEMVLGGDVGKITKEQKEILNEAYLGNERMIKLVNDLMDVSKIDAGRFELKLESMQLENLIAEIVKEILPFAKEKYVSLSYIPPSAKLPKVKIDRQRVKQALQNLIDNAIKYSHIDSKGKVTIKIQKEEKSLKVIVKDNGIGIPKDEQEKIFGRFLRGSNVAQLDPGGGTGLGLYIAKAIIEQSGGKIWFVSEAGKGTTFYATLPYR